MTVVPCAIGPDVRRRIEHYADALQAAAFSIGSHGLSPEEFENSGLFRGAIERLRGQFAASMAEKRAFAAAMLDRLAEVGRIASWVSAGGANRFDYLVDLASGRRAAVELKGCLDGNNTNIFERPVHADEFLIWSICTRVQTHKGDSRRAWFVIHAPKLRERLGWPSSG